MQNEPVKLCVPADLSQSSSEGDNANQASIMNPIILPNDYGPQTSVQQQNKKHKKKQKESILIKMNPTQFNDPQVQKILPPPDVAPALSLQDKIPNNQIQTGVSSDLKASPIICEPAHAPTLQNQNGEQIFAKAQNAPNQQNNQQTSSQAESADKQSNCDCECNAETFCHVMILILECLRVVFCCLIMVLSVFGR